MASNTLPATRSIPYVLLSRQETALPALPVFALEYANHRRSRYLTYETKLARHNIQATLRWQVSAGPTYGFPDAFDRKVFKIIEYLAIQSGLPIRNPIRISLHEILRLLGLAPFESYLARLRSSIRRIAAVTIYSHMTFLAEQQTGRLSRTFHLYDTVSFQDSSRDDETAPGHHALVFGAWYLDNINQRYIQPIDPQYFHLLRNPIASRLYELLTLKFTDVFQRNLGGWQVTYPSLCHMLPLEPYKFVSPQRHLDPAHRELTATGFLNHVEWDKIDGTWLLTYEPGTRAREAQDLHSLPPKASAPEIRPRTDQPPARAYRGFRSSRIPTPPFSITGAERRRRTPLILTPNSEVPKSNDITEDAEDRILQYWGLTEQPFDNTPNPRFYYPIGQHQEALFKLQHTAKTQTGAAMLSGECGSGKTLLTRTFLHSLDTERYDVALLTNPRWKGIDLLREVLYQLGQEVRSPDKNSILRLMEEQWLKTYEAGRHTVLIIDEAQLIDDFETLEELRLLLNFQLDDRYLLSLILVGQPELNTHIDAIPQFEQRLVFRHHLSSMSQEEAEAYILHRLDVAGASREIFTPDGLKRVFDRSDGVPRRINTLCRTSLLAGWSRRCETLDETVVAAAADSRFVTLQ